MLGTLVYISSKKRPVSSMTTCNVGLDAMLKSIVPVKRSWARQCASASVVEDSIIGPVGSLAAAFSEVHPQRLNGSLSVGVIKASCQIMS
jgi:hypothetical protein